MLKKEYELLIPFLTFPWRKFTLRQIKKAAKKTSESYTYTNIKKYVKENILQEEKAGNVTLYSLSLNNPKSQVYCGFIAEYIAWKKPQLPFKVLQKVSAKIPTDFYVFIVTGSYARNMQKSTSDVDVVILIDNEAQPNKVYAALKLECQLSIPEVHLYVFKQSEFLEMLLNKEANYGKAIAENNLILYGGQIYYKIINEAIKRGFGDKSLSW